MKQIDLHIGIRKCDSAHLVAPRTELEQQLAHIWRKLLRLERVGIHDNFFELGGDSFMAARLFAQIEKATGKVLPLTTLLEASTIERLAAVIEREGYESPWECVVPIKPDGSKPPLFCVHGVGGNVISYLDLGRYIDPDQPLYGIQAVGLSGRRPRRNLTVEQMAEIYLEEVRSFQSRGPYYLAGTSFGGGVAYEMARQLTAKGEEVAFIGLFDTYAPGYPKMAAATSRWEKYWNRQRFRFHLHWGNLKALAPRERAGYVSAKSKRLKNALKHRFKVYRHNAKVKIREKVERLFWPAAVREANKAGHWAAGDYVPKPFGAHVTLFRATEQPPGIVPDPTLGWGPIVSRIETYDTPGHHGAIVLEPRVRVLAQQLNDALAKAHARTAPSVSRSWERTTAIA